MKMLVELNGRRLQELTLTILVEVPNDTPPDALHRVCSSVFEEFTLDDYLWECDDSELVEFDGINSVEASEDDDEDDADLRLVLGNDGTLVAASTETTSESKTNVEDD